MDAGANIDAQSSSGGTALMRAIESSQKSIVKLLLGHGLVLQIFLTVNMDVPYCVVSKCKLRNYIPVHKTETSG